MRTNMIILIFTLCVLGLLLLAIIINKYFLRDDDDTFKI